VGYAPVEADSKNTAVLQGIFKEQLLVFRQVSGRKLGLETTLLLCETLRSVVMKSCESQPPPEWISGHTVDGRPTNLPHLAFLPLANVGNDHAQGHIMGMAIAVPKTITRDQLGHGLSRLFDLDENGEPKPIHLYHGEQLDLKIQLDLTESKPVGLQVNTWVGAGQNQKQWATVTPVVLDRHGHGNDVWAGAEETIKFACERIGLPRPATVVLTPTSPFTGAPHKCRYPPLLRRDGSKRQHTHAFLIFDQPVRGPIIVGAGRFRGYGLCRPWQAYSPSRTDRR
jgi:CRISPR-associated protein Csb2